MKNEANEWIMLINYMYILFFWVEEAVEISDDN